MNISVAAPQLQQEFGLTPGDLGLLFSAFFWSYAILQIPVGIVLDRLGVTTVSRIGAFLWGVASGVVAFATGFGSIFAARVLLGVAEAPAFPANSKATGYWFPRGERATATAIFDAAAKFSNVIGVPLVAVAVVTFGWRWGFGLTAILSFAYFLAYWFVYRDPSADTKLSHEERDYIREGRRNAGRRIRGEPHRHARVSACAIGRFGVSPSALRPMAIHSTSSSPGLPGYLVSEMHMSIIKSAGYAAIPWLFATISDLVVGGWLIDHLLAKGYDDTKTRKTVLVGGMILGLAVFGATMTTSPVWAIFWIIDCAQRARGGGAGRLVNSFAHCAEGRHRHDRRRDELLQQSHGRNRSGRHRLRCRRDEFLFARVPGGGNRAPHRHLLLRRRARKDRADPRAGRAVPALPRLREARDESVTQTNGSALVVMGVSGSGKTTVAELLAKQLGWPFMEGDRLHPPANVEKMRQGIPLTDADRWPWLDRIGEELKSWARRGQVRRADLLGAQARLSRSHPLGAAGRSLHLSERLGSADRGPRHRAPS